MERLPPPASLSAKSIFTLRSILIIPPCRTNTYRIIRLKPIPKTPLIVYDRAGISKVLVQRLKQKHRLLRGNTHAQIRSLMAQTPHRPLYKH